MSPKILHITWSMSIGGAERAIFQLIKAQREAGMHADLLIASMNEFYGKQAGESGAKVLELKQSSGLDLTVGKKFRELVEPYDILHFQRATVALLYFASRLQGKKLVYTHRSGAHAYTKKQMIKYKIAGYFFRKSFTGISANTQHAARVAARLFSIPAEQLQVTYNGLDFSLLEPKRSVKDVLSELGQDNRELLRIGTSANLRTWKRVDLLLHALSGLRDIPLHCYVLGDGPALASLRDLSAQLQIDDRLFFLGKKEHIGDYLQLFDVFVLPSDTSESFGNSAVEAMGMGIPTIVMRDGGGLIEHMDDVSELIAEDETDLVSILRLLLSDAQRRKLLGNTAKKSVHDKYSLQQMVQSYNDFYKY